MLKLHIIVELTAMQVNVFFGREGGLTNFFNKKGLNIPTIMFMFVQILFLSLNRGSQIMYFTKNHRILPKQQILKCNSRNLKTSFFGMKMSWL